MTQSDRTTPDPAPVSVITKHIQIYSDNPIHEAIDRIINSCACIDEGDDYGGMASHELREAAEDLLALACHNLSQSQRKKQRRMNETRPN